MGASLSVALRSSVRPTFRPCPLPASVCPSVPRLRFSRNRKTTETSNSVELDKIIWKLECNTIRWDGMRKDEESTELIEIKSKKSLQRVSSLTLLTELTSRGDSLGQFDERSHSDLVLGGHLEQVGRAGV